MSKLNYDGVSKMTAKQKKRHELCCSPILSMSDEELDVYLEDNLRSAVDTREFLKQLTKIVAAISKGRP